jgi:hypothetical protein
MPWSSSSKWVKRVLGSSAGALKNARLVCFRPNALSGYFFRQDGDAFGVRRLSQVLIEGGKRKAKTHR